MDLRAHLAGFDTPMMRRLVKNAGYLFSATGVSGALSLVQGILTARLLGVAGFGILGAVITFTSTVNKLISFRMSELVIKYVGEYSEARQDGLAAAIFKLALGVEFGASLVAFGIIWLLAPWGAVWLAKDAAAAPLFVLYGLIVLANLVAESSTGLLQIFDRFRRLAVLNVAQSALTLLGITAAYFGGGGLREVLLAYLVGKAVSAGGITLAAWREAGRHWGPRWWRVSLAPLRPRLRELTRFAVATNLSASLSLVNKDSEILWVSFLRSPVEAGYYKLALTLANLVQLPVSPLPQTTYPELARAVGGGRWDDVRQVLRRTSLLGGGYSLLAGLFLLVTGPWLIRRLYTPEFLPAYPALLILLAGFLVANIFLWRRQLLLVLGLPEFATQLNLVLAGLKVAGIFLLTPRGGYLANAGLLAGFYITASAVGAWKGLTTLKDREAQA